MNDDLPISLLLTDDALKGAREVDAITKDYRNREDLIRRQYQEQADALTQETNAKLQAAWEDLMATVKLPASLIGRYTLDVRYLNGHGLAFLQKKGACQCGADHGDDEPAMAGSISELLGRIGGMKH